MNTADQGSHRMVYRNVEAVCRSGFGVLWSFMRGCATTTDRIAIKAKENAPKGPVCFHAGPFHILNNKEFLWRYYLKQHPHGTIY